MLQWLRSAMDVLQSAATSSDFFARAARAMVELVCLDSGAVLLRQRPVDFDATVDPLGPAPAAAGLLRAVKARLDPDGRCAPGRLAPWL